MIAVRRLFAVGAILALAVAFTQIDVWGEPGRGKKRKDFHKGESKIKVATASPDDEVEASASPFADKPVVLYQKKKGETWFALQIKPKLPDAPARPRDYLVLVDTSASKARGPLQIAQNITQELAKKLGAKDRMAIWTVNITSTDLTRGLKGPKALDDAVKRLRAEIPLGAVNLKGALTRAVDAFDGRSGRQRVILYLGDGRSVAEPLNDEDRTALSAQMVKQKIAFFAVPLGFHMDPLNLHGFVGSTGGKCIRVEHGEELAPFVARLQKDVGQPIFYPTRVDLPRSVTEALPSKLPPLRRDVSTLMIGKLASGKKLALSLRGTQAGKEIRVAVSEKVPDPDTENVFLLEITRQWRAAKDRPALIQGDRALGYAYKQHQLAMEDLLAKGEIAIEENKLEVALRLYQQARELDPHDARPRGGMRLIEDMKSGKKTRKQMLAALKLNAKERKVIRIAKGKRKILVLADGDERKDPPDAGPVDPLDDVKARRAVANQQATQMVNETIRQANRLVRTDPDSAYELLKQTREGVQANTDLTPAVASGLAARLARAMAGVEREGKMEKRRIEEALVLRAAADARLEARNLEAAAQNRIRERMRVFHNLMDQAREMEAYRQAVAIRQDLIDEGRTVPPAVTAGLRVGLSGYHLRELRELVRLRQERWLATMLEVERSNIPFPDEPPVEYPSAAMIRKITRGTFNNWRDFSKERIARYSVSSFGADMPGRAFELRDLLNKSFKWEDIEEDKTTTLELILEQLGKARDITFDIDERAFKHESLTNVEKTPIVESGPIKGGTYTLATQLKKILARIPVPSGATYVIRRDVIEITTTKFQLADKVVRVYPVADLVIPIPNAFNASGIIGAATILGTNVGNVVGNPIGNPIGNPVGNPIGNPIGNPVGNPVGNPIGNPIGNPVGNPIGNPVGNPIGFQNRGQNQGVVGQQIGQFGNLGGQFGIQGGDQSQILVTLIRQVVGRPKDWAPQFDPVTGQPINPLDDTAGEAGLERDNNNLGYYPPALALVVKAPSRIHSRVSSVVLTTVGDGDGAPDGKGAVGGGRGRRGSRDKLKKKGPPPDPRTIWKNALARGVDQPGLIIATADFLALNNKWDHATEFLKANLRQGVVIKPWVFQSLAVSMRESGASAEEIERAEVSAADIEPLDWHGYLQAARALSQDGHHARGIAFCRQAAALAPGLPHPYADAVGYAELAGDVKAMEWAAGNLLKQDWPVNNHALHTRATQKLEALVKALAKSDRKALAKRLRKAIDAHRRRDLVIKLAWQGEADLDLKVLEPTGSTCWALSKQTVGGGTLLGDTLDNMNSETYVAAQGFSGKYVVTVEKVWGRPLGNKAQLKIIHHQGTDDETEELITIRMNSNISKPIVVKLADGRRKETAYVAPAAAMKPPPPREALASTNRIFQQLRNLANPEVTEVSRSISGGAGSTLGRYAGSRRFRGRSAVNPADRTVYQNKVSSFVKNAMDVTARTVLSADRRSVRVSLTPVFAGAPGKAPAQVVSPIFPGARR
jgi:hypothetical protein